MSNKELTIGIVVGETSGDILGAGLMREIKKRVPNARFVGIAGPQMQEQGCAVLFDMESISVMGIAEIIRHIPSILSIRSQLVKHFRQLKPDVFIGIDAPDFNLTLEYQLKKNGIPIVHYVSPSVWAWRQGRIYKIAKATNLVLTLLPFEKAFYDRHQVPCQFVGHTMADAIPLHPDKQKTREHLAIQQDEICLALLPGSRSAEIAFLAPVFLQAANLLYQQHPKLRILVPMVNQQRCGEFLQLKNTLAASLPLDVFIGHAREVMMASDIALLASGTASLECMLAKCPMVVAYKMNKLTYAILKRLVKTHYISLPNLLSDTELVKEFIQDDCTAEHLANALNELILSPEKNNLMKQAFLKLHQQIKCHADEQAAEAILKLINI